MQGNNLNSGGQKQTGLSWTQPASQSGQGDTAKNKPATASNSQQAKSNTASSASARAAALNMSASTPRLAGTFIAGLLVGGLLTWMLVSIGGASDQAGGNNTGGGATSTESITGGGATSTSGAQAVAMLSLDVEDQDARSEVSVGDVEVSQPTWVVVYDSVNGEPGRALGAKMFFPGSGGSEAVIKLLRPTIAGQEYLIGGRIDNGDHAFDGATDAAVVNQAGNRILLNFEAE